jgi:hypothetical protein
VTVTPRTTADTTPRLTGTVDDDTATVSVTVDGTTYTAVNNGDGTWTLADTTALALGTYDVEVTAADAAGNEGSDGTSDELAVVVPTDIAVHGGNNQSTKVNTAFGRKLSVLVTDVNGNPVADVPVTFRIPGSGPGGHFPGNVRTVIVTTGADGVAEAPTLRANGKAGTFQVRATHAGLADATFRLTNKTNKTTAPRSPALPAPQVVRFVVNDGTPSRSAVNTLTLVFNQAVNVFLPAFRLTRVVVANGVIVQRLEVVPMNLAQVRVVNGRTEATLRVGRPLVDGVYQLFVNRGQVRNAEKDIMVGDNTFRFFQG